MTTTPIDSTTKMTNPPTKQTKMVKIKAIYPIRVGKGDEEKVITEGNTVVVSEEEAKEFCDRKYAIGHKGFSGYQFGALSTQAVRAVRVG